MRVSVSLTAIGSTFRHNFAPLKAIEFWAVASLNLERWSAVARRGWNVIRYDDHKFCEI